MKHISTLLLLVCCFCSFLAGCGDDSEPTKANDFVELTAISVTSEYPQITDKTTCQMTATGDFSGLFSATISDTATWVSSDYNIATIDTNGLLSAVSPGIINITASQDGIIGTLTNFAVTNTTINSVTLSPTNPSIPLGLTQQFSAEGLFYDGTEQTITNVISTWDSSDYNVATIDENGLATSDAAGTATISATFDGTTGTTTLTVIEATLESISIEPATAEISVGLLQKYTATGYYVGGGERDITTDVAWTSDNTAIATPSATPGEEGYFTGIGIVTTPPFLITATLGTISNNSELYVNDLTLSSITIDPEAPAAILADEELPLTATGNYASDGGSEDITANLRWTSTSIAVAEVSMLVDEEGLVTGKNVGSTLITATGGGQSKQITVVVE